MRYLLPLLIAFPAYADEPSMKVLRATFSGQEFGRGYTCNAKDVVAALCEGTKGCKITVDASFCEGKLLPGNGSLSVMYTCAGKGQSIQGEVGKTLELKCE